MISEKFKAVRQTIDFAKVAVKTKKPSLAIIYLSMIPEDYKNNALFKTEINNIECYVRQAKL